LHDATDNESGQEHKKGEVPEEKETEGYEGPTEAAEVAWEAQVRELRDQLEKERERSEALQKSMLYLRADLENYMKRIDTEIEEMSKSSLTALTSELLGVIDELELAVKAGQGVKGAEQLTKGIEMALKKLYKALEQHGIVRISAVGRPFDPRLHEAVERVPTTKVPEGRVVEEIRAGFLLGDKVIRPSAVKVSCAPAPNNEEGGVEVKK